jgi:pyridoxal phosphate-dependent aminotransferase EpsN
MNGEEYKYLKNAIDSNWIAPLGPHVDSFENEVANYIGVEHAAALSSGTAALHLSLKVLEIGEGDFVFCSDLTFIASANAIRYVGAIPIFIDSEEASWNMCPKSLEIAFNDTLPKAVIVTDLYGQSADYDAIKLLCNKYNVPIIEDAAESLGAEYNNTKCGSIGELAILSFNGNKIITNSSGGMLLSDKKNYIDKARKLSTQSREEAIHYEHTEIGYNYRMSNVLAAIGRAQFKSLDEYVEKTRFIFNYYLNNLKDKVGITFMPEIYKGRSTNWLSVILIENMKHKKIENIINSFSKKNIEIRPIWKPMHLQPVFNGYKFFYVNKKPVSEYLFEHGLCLPSGTNLSNKDLDIIINLLEHKIG